MHPLNYGIMFETYVQRKAKLHSVKLHLCYFVIYAPLEVS